MKILKKIIFFLIVLVIIFFTYSYYSYTQSDEYKYLSLYETDKGRNSSYYKSRCREYDYEGLLRYPEKYEGLNCVFKGEVIQVIESEDINYYLVNTGINDYNVSIDVRPIYIFVSRDLVGSRILNGDIVELYGSLQGLYSYTTITELNATVPLVFVQYIDIIG